VYFVYGCERFSSNDLHLDPEETKALQKRGVMCSRRAKEALSNGKYKYVLRANGIMQFGQGLTFLSHRKALNHSILYRCPFY